MTTALMLAMRRGFRSGLPTPRLVVTDEEHEMLLEHAREFVPSVERVNHVNTNFGPVEIVLQEEVREKVHCDLIKNRMLN